tara:strand:- start:46407 stop:47657 length:1251 start_codon:yes stop_codon:yes gene_type:complete
MLFERISRLVINLFVGVWLARYLGPSDFGTLNFGIAIVSIFLPLVDFGLQGILVKELFNNPKEKDYILGTSFTLKLFISAIIFIGITLTMNSEFFQDSIENKVVVLVSISLFFHPFLVLENWYESQVKAKKSSILKTIFFLISSIVKIICIITKEDLITFALLYAIESFLIAIAVLITYYLESNSIFDWRFKFGVLKYLTYKSWLLVFSSMSAVVYLKLDQIMLGAMVTDKELGLYSAAVKLSEAWYFIPLILSNALFPAILGAKKKGKKEYLQRLQQLCDLYFILSFTLALIITFTAPFIINFLYGHEYASSILILQIHIWAAIFIFLRTVLSKWLIAEDKYKFSLISQLSGAIVNVILNWLLIPKYGGAGAAIATIISYSVMSFFVLILFRDTRVILIIFVKSILSPFRLLIKL